MDVKNMTNEQIERVDALINTIYRLLSSLGYVEVANDVFTKVRTFDLNGKTEKELEDIEYKLSMEYFR